jgi:SH3-like domain-containing protein
VVVPPARPPDNVGTVTGMKLPRWAALRADDVNLRVGPGTRFPIDWQYHRRDLPVLILREVEVWRLIEDQDGVKGWVHQATLIGRRSFEVKGAEAVLRAAAGDDAAPVARLKPGVIGRIRSCEAAAAWCEVQVEDFRGWLRRDQFWGTDAGEPVGN